MTASRLQPGWRHSRNELSGKPGAVQPRNEMVLGPLVVAIPALSVDSISKGRRGTDKPVQ